MKDVIEAMESLTPKLAELESQMARGDLAGKDLTDLLGPNPQLGFSKLIEFKATIDRMRGLTWVYLEAAANAGKFPNQRIPKPLREFLQQQAAHKKS